MINTKDEGDPELVLQKINRAWRDGPVWENVPEHWSETGFLNCFVLFLDKLQRHKSKSKGRQVALWESKKFLNSKGYNHQSRKALWDRIKILLSLHVTWYISRDSARKSKEPKWKWPIDLHKHFSKGDRNNQQMSEKNCQHC